jgi:hypothetical protein
MAMPAGKFFGSLLLRLPPAAADEAKKHSRTKRYPFDKEKKDP